MVAESRPNQMEIDVPEAMWDAFAPLRPTLTSDLQVARQHCRGRDWWVLRNALTQRYVRVDEASYRLLLRLNGRVTLRGAMSAELREPLRASDAIGLLDLCREAGVVRVDLPPDAQRVAERRAQRNQKAALAKGLSVMFWRQPILNPDRWLDAVTPSMGWLFGRLGATLWLVLVAVGGLHLIGNRSDFAASLAASLRFDPWYLLLTVVAFVGLKLLHEVGHGIACKHFSRDMADGGEVPTLGVMLLVMLPMPYIDVSSVWLIGSKWKRVAVSMAGVYVELAVAALAAIVWAHTGPGTLHTLAFQVVILASVATVLFNANPLLRFDGYYALSDAIELPNLAGRAQRRLSQRVRTWLGVATPMDHVGDSAEARWLDCYAVAALLYRLLISVSIVLFVSGRWLIAGDILAALAVVGWLVLPLGRFGFDVLKEARGTAAGWSVLRRVGLGLAVPILFLAVVPVPDTATANGVVQPTQTAEITAPVAGEITSFAAPGTWVEAGKEALVKIDAPMLTAEYAAARVRRAEALTHANAEVDDPAIAASWTDRAEAWKRRLEDTEARIADQTVAAPIAGIWLPDDAAAQVGAHVDPARGGRLGRVIDPRTLVVSVAADQTLGPRLAQTLATGDKVRVRVAGRSIDGVVQTIAPAGQRRLASAALGQAGGGSFLLADPQRDAHRTSEPFFEITVLLTHPTPADQANVRVLCDQRARVLFDLPPRPLAVQWIASIRQAFQPRASF